MKRFLSAILTLGAGATTWFALLKAHQLYNSLWLDLFLVLFIALPIMWSLLRITFGSAKFNLLFAHIVIAVASLVAISLMYQKLTTHNWVIASLVGVVIFYIVSALVNYRIYQAQTKLTTAAQVQEKGNPGQALKLATEARFLSLKSENRAIRSLAEWRIGLAYVQLGDLQRAAQYISSALALFRAQGDQKRITEAEEALRELRQRGVSVPAQPQIIEEALLNEGIHINWGQVIEALCSLIGIVVLLLLWRDETFQGSIPVILGLGVASFSLVYGAYGITALAARPSRPLWASSTSFVLYILALCFFVLGITRFLLAQRDIQVKDFPAALQNTVTWLASKGSGWPIWVLVAIILCSLLLLLVSLVIASGRSSFVVADSRQRALREASEYLQAQNWEAAIRRLGEIDLLSERNEERHKQMLFYLAFAHHMAKQSKEAQSYLDQLLARDAQHKEGLYLAGYITLQTNKLDGAEQIWRRLASSAARVQRVGDTFPEANVRYYLCLTLYRKAMAQMKGNFVQGVELLTEAGKIGALDAEIAEALVRAHLYQCALFIRQSTWNQAEQEIKLALKKLQPLQQLPQNSTELSKLNGLCYAAIALIAFRQARYDEALNNFRAADTATEALAQSRKLFNQPGKSVLEQMLRAMMEAQEASEKKISPLFGRDLHFLIALILLRDLQARLNQSPDKGWRSALEKIEAQLQKSLECSEDFDEGRTMLGLLYYYLGTDRNKQKRGIELLQMAQARIAGTFVKETLTHYETHEKRRVSWQKAYFDLLEQYLRFSNVSLADREAMRNGVLETMRATGEFEAFMGGGRLQVATRREREPTVEEYSAHTALLLVKLEELMRSDDEERVTPEVRRLFEVLRQQNEMLKLTVQTIVRTEKDLLNKAQELL